MLVDKDLRSNYDSIEASEMVQVALLCTQYLPINRPKMSEVVKMLEGDGLAHKWEASQTSHNQATEWEVKKKKSNKKLTDTSMHSDDVRMMMMPGDDDDDDDGSSLDTEAMELSGPR